MNLPAVAVKDETTILDGGLDQVTPTLDCPPGALRESINWETDLNGGYRYPSGFEIFDGKRSPSSIVPTLLYVTTFQNVPAVGDTVTGLSSTSTGKILALVNTATQKYMVLYWLSGPGFEGGETVLVGATTVGVATAPTILPSPKESAQYVALAVDQLRLTIGTPPGVGPVRGVVGAVLNGQFQRFAFRDDISRTKCNIWKATVSGWTPVTLHARLRFTNAGPVAFQEGLKVRVFGSDYTIKRAVWQSGTYDTNTAAGWLILETTVVSGGLPSLFSPYTIGGTTFTVPSGEFTRRIVIAPGGTYEFDVENFGGQFDSQRIYGCDGVNYLFEFDGEVYVPIPTGTSTDRPTHVKAHHNHLFVAIGSSLINSGLGLPYNWTDAAGAAELATGQPVTGFEVMPGNQDNAAMAVFNRNKTRILYGTSSANWKLVPLESDTGALPYSTLKMEQVYVWDDRGVVGMTQGMNFGNFDSATHTAKIQPFIDSKRGRLLCACVNRSKNQLRYFFNDGTALYLTIVNGKLRGASPMYFPVTFTCVWSGETESGLEATYAGGADGNVYQLDMGTSHNGLPIFTWAKGVWNPLKSPRRQKHYYRGAFGIRGSFVELYIKHELGFGDDRISQAPLGNVLWAPAVLPQYDHASMGWDSFTWDGRKNEIQDFRLGGDGEAIRYHLTSNVNYLQSFTLESVMTAFSYRRSLHG